MPLFSRRHLELLNWASAYYHHPVGEVIFSALPTGLRKGQTARLPLSQFWLLSEQAPKIDDPCLQRSIKQRQLIKLLTEQQQGASAEVLRSLGPNWRSVAGRLVEKGWAEMIEQEDDDHMAQTVSEGSAPGLNNRQQTAVDEITTGLNRFQVFLLDGVTGSGKTEVYFRVIDEVITTGHQAMVLIPEIAMTTQLIDRFRQRFSCPIAVLHSGLNDSERLKSWLMARDAKAPIIIGTRSAIWTPMARPGLIVIDEEHDPSYKQQDGFRYSARDVAIVRAQRDNIPVILGSATPSLESLNNIDRGRYRHLQLPERAGDACHPAIRFIDIRKVPIENGMSPQLIDKIRQCLNAGRQAILFLNRRGYAPVIMCHDCGWIATCRYCDAHLTFHQRHQQMRCHHCGAQQAMISICPECESNGLIPVGQGTERITESLQDLFPKAKILRIDRDTTRQKGSMSRMLDLIDKQQADILVGTQMLSKGHHFPNVTLVGILDADNRLYATDFRASERLAQLIVQVAGRAGRAEHPGEVFIQTHHPEHPVLQSLVRGDYAGLARQLLSDRHHATLPPFASMVMIRAEAASAGGALEFLQKARAEITAPASIEIWGPVIASMERRAGRYRAQLFIQATDRHQLHRFLDVTLERLDNFKKAPTLRWSVDVDPQDTF